MTHSAVDQSPSVCVEEQLLRDSAISVQVNKLIVQQFLVRSSQVHIPREFVVRFSEPLNGAVSTQPHNQEHFVKALSRDRRWGAFGELLI
jgi:hypothetical protein